MKDHRVTVSTEGTILVAASMDELHRFAESVGLTVASFVNHRTFPHYQLGTSTMRNRALDAGAHLRTRGFVKKLAGTCSGRKR